jgi:electron transport complex protein RnfC
MGLEPYILQLLSEQKNYEEAEQHHIMDCMECGSCQYTCPSNRALLDYVRVGKSKVGAMIRARAASQTN